MQEAGIAAQRSDHNRIPHFGTRVCDTPSSLQRDLNLFKTYKTPKIPCARRFKTTAHPAARTTEKCIPDTVRSCSSCARPEEDIYNPSTLAGQIPKFALVKCGSCERIEEQKRRKENMWWREKWNEISRVVFGISKNEKEHVLCEICRGYEEEEEGPTRILPVF